ncbi:MAG: MBG domain-containing protein, partial [Fibromonadales bacterium]|nr:MBG domain-containing protein [Fibromonadales bacterium]
ASLEAGYRWEDNTLENKSIPWSIAPATRAFVEPPAMNVTYSPALTLESLDLPSDYAWASPSTQITSCGALRFDAAYLDISGNYALASGGITVNVAQAIGTFPLLPPIDAPYVPGQTLQFVSLPLDYEWENSAAELGFGDGKVFSAIYTDPSGNYTSAKGNITVNVPKGTGSGTVTIADWVYGEDASTPSASSETNLGTPVFRYSGVSNGGNEYQESAVPPSLAGSYTVTATFLSNANYNELSVSENFTILRAEGNGTVSIEDWYFGEPPKSSFISSTNGIEGAEFLYWSEDGESYLPNPSVPSNIGLYVVEVTFPQKANYEAYQARAKFEIKARKQLTVTWEDKSVFVYNKMVQYPRATARDGDLEIPLTITNIHSEAGTYSGQSAPLAIITDEVLRSRYTLLNNTVDYEITKKTLKPYFNSAAEMSDFKFSADTVWVPRNVFADSAAMQAVLSSVIDYQGFATDTLKHESDNSSVLSAAPAVSLQYFPVPSSTYLARRVETNQRATATIITDDVSATNYALVRNSILIMETIDESETAVSVSCFRSDRCTMLNEEVCEKIGGDVVESCVMRKSCLMGNVCVNNMLIGTCFENGGTAIAESCEGMTPIINSQLSTLNSTTPLYYDLKGTPLGTAKPATPGIYIEKQGKHVRKIVVK